MWMNYIAISSHVSHNDFLIYFFFSHMILLIKPIREINTAHCKLHNLALSQARIGLIEKWRMEILAIEIDRDGESPAEEEDEERRDERVATSKFRRQLGRNNHAKGV